MNERNLFHQKFQQSTTEVRSVNTSHLHEFYRMGRKRIGETVEDRLWRLGERRGVFP